MSKDFIAFDSAGLGALPPKHDLLEWIHARVGDGEACSMDHATGGIATLLRWASERYGSTVDEHSIWTSWPPSLLADGHHCTFNLSAHADAMTFTMVLCDQCKRLGLIMIDPSGKEPFVTIPGGGGLLDV